MDRAVINILVLSLILGSHLLVSGYAVMKEDQNEYKGEAEKKGNPREKKSINVAANRIEETEDEKTAIKYVLAGIKDLAEIETNVGNRMKKSYTETAADEALYDEDGNIILIRDALYDHNDYFDEEYSEIVEKTLNPDIAEHQPNLAMLNELASLISMESKEGCALEDTMKEEGESWMESCNTCTCIRGQPVCTTRECSQVIGSETVTSVKRETSPVGATVPAMAEAAVVGPVMASAIGIADPVVAALPVMSEASVVPANPGVPVAAPAVVISPALAALVPAVAASSVDRVAQPVVVATPNVAGTAAISAVAASPAVGPAMASAVRVADPVVANLPVMSEASAVAVNPGVPVEISPPLAALAPAVAAPSVQGVVPPAVVASSVEGVVPPAMVATPKLSETSPVSAVAAPPEVAVAPVVAALAQEVAAAALAAMSSPTLTALSSKVEAEVPAVAVAPSMVALAPEVAAAPEAMSPSIFTALNPEVRAEATALAPSPALAALVSKMGAESPPVAPSQALAELASVVAAAASVMEAMPSLVVVSSSPPPTVAEMSHTTITAEATAEPVAETMTTLHLSITPESNISLEMSSSTSESTIQTPCSEWGVNNSTQEECKLPWTMIGGDCLFLTSNQNASNFIDSQNSCKELHADAELAIPTDLHLIKEYLLKKESFLVKRNLWVGGSDSCTPGEAQWLNGSEINNTLWLNGEPTLNNTGNDCVVLDMNSTKLITKSCTEDYKFICQKAASRTINSKPTIQSSCYYWGVNKTNPEECKLPWTMIGSDCLLLSSNHNISTLNDSRDFCKMIHAEADLAILTDFSLIKDFLQNKGSTLINHNLWVGGSDSCTPGEPRWLNGSPINNNLWKDGKLTSNNKGNECVVVDVKNNNLLTKTCTEQYKFICQKSAKIIK